MTFIVILMSLKTITSINHEDTKYLILTDNKRTSEIQWDTNRVFTRQVDVNNI